MSLLSYECHASLPPFGLSYPADWLLDESRARPNRGSVEITAEDYGGTVTVEWGPDLSPHGELELAASRFSRHEVVQQQRVMSEGVAWSELVYHAWPDAKAQAPDRCFARFTQRSGLIWRVAYRLMGATGARRRPAAEAIAQHFHFLPTATPAPDVAWRHHRFMAGSQEFAFNHPAAWEVVPEVQGEVGSCSVTSPEGGVFQVRWGRAETAESLAQRLRQEYREVSFLLDRPGLLLPSGTWAERVFDGTRQTTDAWGSEQPQPERGRLRFGRTGGVDWVLGYRLPHATLAEEAPAFERMLASMRILGTQELARLPEPPEPRGIQLELGLELALALTLRQGLQPVGLFERLTPELQVLRTMMAHEGYLLPHLAVVAHPEAPLFGYRLRAGGQGLLERDLSKSEFEPLVQILEELRHETPRLDALLTPRLARPERVQELFPRAPKAYEHLRALRPELNLPPLTQA